MVADRLLTRGFVLLGLAELAYFTSVGVGILALPLTVTGRLGSDESGAGLAFGAFAITALVCRPFAGRLVDSRGRRPLLLCGALLAAVATVLVPFVDSLALVVGLRLVQGVAEASFAVAGFALLADLAPPDRMGEALSYNSLGLFLGIGLGPVVGEAVAAHGGLDAAWWVAGGLAVLSALLVLGLAEPDHQHEEAGHGQLVHRPALPLMVGFVASLVAMSAFFSLAALHAAHVGLADRSRALLVYGGTVVVCRVVFARVPDRYPSLPLATAALATIAAGLVLIGSWTTPTGFLAGAMVTAVGVTFATPAFFSAIFATALPSERGAASGTASAAIDLGLGVGPIALGVVAAQASIPWAFVAAAAVALAGGAWTLALAVRPATSLST